MTEDEMVGWHHRLDGPEFEKALGVGDGQGSLTCYSLGRGLSGLHWAWCIGRGPHLRLRQEPQGTSDFRLRSQGPCRLGTGESGLVLG